MTQTLRRTAASASDFRAWLRGAQPGDRCTYHVGQMARDRAGSAKLAELADCVTMFAELSIVTPVSYRMVLAVGPRVVYSATRTSARLAPRALVTGQIKPLEYRALRALADRDVNARQSATRCLRDAIAMPEGKGRVLLETLHYRRLVERDAVVGWQISDRGRELIR